MMMQRYSYKRTFILLLMILVLLFVWQNLYSENPQLKNDADSIAKVFTEKSIVYSDSTGNLAFEYAEKALFYAKISGNNKTIANAYHAKALAYQEKGKYNEAIINFDSVIIYATEANDIFRLNTSYNNLGVILRKEGAFDAAIIQFEKALNYAKKCSDTLSLAYCYSNIGNCFAAKNEYNLAIINYSKALNIFIELGDYKFNEAYIKNNIAGIFARQNKYNSAKYYYNSALDYFESINNNFLCLKILISLADMSLKEEMPIEAEKYIEKAKQLELNVDDETILSEFYEVAHKVYTSLNNYEQSVYYLDLFTTISNKNQNDELKRLVMETMHQHDKLILETQNKEVQSKLDRKNLILVFTWILVFAISGISVLIFVNYRQKSRLNKQLKEKNQIIEKQNKQINDSIEYAKNIMRLSMGSNEFDADYIKDSFVFFRPREIVGGDFYKILTENNSTLIALGDCTGHGVSGAFLASVYYHLLSKAIQQSGNSLNNILQQLNTEHLNFFGKTNINDISQLQSMVISILLIEKNKNYIEFAGINQILLHCNNQDINIVKSDRYSLGSKEDIKFKVHKIEYKKDDIFILLSDGIIDQLNPDGNAKFGWKHFSEVITKNCDKDLDTIKHEIENEWKNWKGNREQTDDISVIGMRV